MQIAFFILLTFRIYTGDDFSQVHIIKKKKEYALQPYM